MQDGQLSSDRPPDCGFLDQCYPLNTGFIMHAALKHLSIHYLPVLVSDALQVELGMTSSGKESAAASTEWRELRAQVQFLDDECRTLRRKVNAVHAAMSALLLQM